MNISNKMAKMKLLGSEDIKVVTEDIIIEIRDDTEVFWLSWLNEPITLPKPVNRYISNTLGKRYGTLTISSNGKSYIIDTFNKQIEEVDDEITSIQTNVIYNIVYQCKAKKARYRFLIYHSMKGKVLGAYECNDYARTQGFIRDFILVKVADDADDENLVVTSEDIITYKSYRIRVDMQHRRLQQEIHNKAHGIHKCP